MNLPHPFEKASRVKINAQGEISLVDEHGDKLTQLPKSTAHKISKKVEGRVGAYGIDEGDGDGYGEGVGGYGTNFGFGEGYGDDFYGKSSGDGSGYSKQTTNQQSQP